MHRHELDPVSLFSGVALVLIAGGYTLTHTTGVRLHWLLAAPALLVLVGAAVIVSVLRRMRQPALADHSAERSTSELAD
jgi:cytochrome c-type biogenesis protein CcmH/NrfF